MATDTTAVCTVDTEHYLDNILTKASLNLHFALSLPGPQICPHALLNSISRSFSLNNLEVPRDQYMNDLTYSLNPSLSHLTIYALPKPLPPSLHNDIHRNKTMEYCGARKPSHPNIHSVSINPLVHLLLARKPGSHMPICTSPFLSPICYII